MANVLPDNDVNNQILPNNDVGDYTIRNPIAGVENLSQLLYKILEIIIQIGFPVVVLAIIYCGFLFVRAQGNESKLEEAKQALLYTVIGAAIVLGAFAISQIVESTVAGLGSG